MEQADLAVIDPVQQEHTPEFTLEEIKENELKYFGQIAEDSLAFEPHYNLAVLYYNDFVERLAASDSTVSIEGDSNFHMFPLQTIITGITAKNTDGATYERLRDAVTHFEIAHQLDSSHHNTAYGLAACYFVLGAYERSEYYESYADSLLFVNATAR